MQITVHFYMLCVRVHALREREEGNHDMMCIDVCLPPNSFQEPHVHLQNMRIITSMLNNDLLCPHKS